MKTWNIGQKVVIIRHGCTQDYGTIGVIVEINPIVLRNATTYKLKFKDNQSSSYNEVYLQPIEIFNSPLSKTLREE